MHECIVRSVRLCVLVRRSTSRYARSCFCSLVVNVGGLVRWRVDAPMRWYLGCRWWDSELVRSCTGALVHWCIDGFVCMLVSAFVRRCMCVDAIEHWGFGTLVGALVRR